MDEIKSTQPQQPDGDGGGLGEPYQYTPLPEAEPTEPGQDPLLNPRTLWTRLLTIYPGEYDDDIAVDLDDVALEETAESQLRDKRVDDPVYHVSAGQLFEHYEALSYVWGSQENPSRVIVGEERRVLPITRNLDVAMRHLRYPDRPRVIWIDAICIDQTSTTDKNRQVESMRYIFRSTRRVVVWLGPEAGDSDHAMGVIEDIGKKIRIRWDTLEISCVSEEDEDVWGGTRSWRHLPLDERDWTAIDLLIRRPWFERVWIRQEVLLAEEEATIYCGRSCSSLNVFRRGLYRVTDTRPSAKAGLASYVLRPIRHGLERLRFVIQGAKCTDPKDYIYGTLGLLVEGNNLAIRPDYSKSLAEIFQDVVMRKIKSSGSLGILEGCGNDHTVLKRSSSFGNIELPSWVPDWTSGIELPFILAVERRFVRLAPWAEFLGKGVLRVAGIKKGVIQDFNHWPLRPTTHFGLCTCIRRLVPKDAAETQYPGGGSLWDAYRIALCGDCFEDGAIPPHPGFNLSEKDSHIALETIIHGEEPPRSLELWPKDSPEARYSDMVRQCWTTHRFFITEDGLMGWAPEQARQGDHIAIMLGSETPTVLRPIPFQETDQYKVVGPCYLQGFMYGEGFLGALPEGVRPVMHLDEEDLSVFFEFLNKSSGESSLQDPRSDEFSDPDQSWAWRKGQEARGIADIEDLRSAGLDIRYFDLV